MQVQYSMCVFLQVSLYLHLMYMIEDVGFAMMVSYVCVCVPVCELM